MKISRDEIHLLARATRQEVGPSPAQFTLCTCSCCSLLRAHHVATLSRGAAMSHAAGAGRGSKIFSVLPENQEIPGFARGLPATFRVCAGTA